MVCNFAFAKLSMIIMLTGIVSCTSSYDLPTCGIGAYRGASNTHPENTLAAFREAIRLGAHMIEMDVCFTKDRQVVLMHDATVDRTTNGSGSVASLTLEEIKRLDAGRWKSGQFKGEEVPTLKEALQIMPINIWLIIHLRGGKELGECVAQTIIEQKRFHQASMACNSEAAAAALNVDSRILIGMDRSLLNTNVREMIASKEHLFLIRFKSDLAQETPELKAGNFSIIYYDPGAILPKELPALFDAGVHFVLSPDVNLLVKAANKRGIRPLKPHYEAKD